MRCTKLHYHDIISFKYLIPINDHNNASAENTQILAKLYCVACTLRECRQISSSIVYTHISCDQKWIVVSVIYIDNEFYRYIIHLTLSYWHQRRRSINQLYCIISYLTYMFSNLAKSAMNIYKMCQHQVKFTQFVIHHVMIYSICAQPLFKFCWPSIINILDGINPNPCCQFDAKNITKLCQH